MPDPTPDATHDEYDDDDSYGDARYAEAGAADLWAAATSPAELKMGTEATTGSV